ncbi:MAG: hypothetical protein IKW13_03160 [Thermoguttaceae bacterium]|nr:hypothetical protein [Thermoguttaceae bacterium]
MSTTETTVQSWGSRLGSSMKGVLVGFLFVLASIALLFWNEGRTVNRAKALNEGASAVITVDAAKVDPQNDGKLVHLSGEVATADVLEDLKFGVSVNAIKLVRKVESYQWQENEKSTTKRGSGGSQETTTTYTYEKVWSPELINSSSFKEAGHENPTTRPVDGAEYVASNVSLGAFRLSADLISRLGPAKAFVPPVPEAAPTAVEAAPAVAPAPVEAAAPTAASAPVEAAAPTAASAPVEAAAPTAASAPAETVVEVPQTVAQDAISVAPAAPAQAISVAPTAPAQDAISVAPAAPAQAISVAPAAPAQTIVVNAPAQNAATEFKRTETGFYFGADPNAPQIGDVRVTFEIVEAPRPASVVSQQNGDSFVPYQAKTGSVELLSNKIETAEAMFASAKRGNATMGWILRLVGFAVMFIGFSSIFKPLEVLADIVPFLGSLVGLGTGLVSFALSLCGSLTTIAIAWLYFRPLIAIPLLIAAVGSLVWLFVKAKGAKAKAAEPAK